MTASVKFRKILGLVLSLVFASGTAFAQNPPPNGGGLGADPYQGTMFNPAMGAAAAGNPALMNPAMFMRGPGLFGTGAGAMPSPSPSPLPSPPPEPMPTLFQMFIQKTTGELLPIFGHELFDRADSFTEQQSAPVPADYAVGPGDELLLKIYGGSINFDQRAVVDREGMISLPKVGPVSVAGVRMSELEKHLKRRISRVLSNFSLSVSMGQIRGIEVYIVGQARQPGKYVVGGLSTVISALFSTSGPTGNGSLRNIQLVRNSKVVATVDLYDFLLRGDTSKDMRLLSGDVIKIPPVGPAVALRGTIPTPAVYELASSGPASTVKEILAIAGGAHSQTSPLQAVLERIEPGKDKPLSAQTFTLSGEGLATALKDGDIVTFFAIKASFENAVTLRLLDEPAIRVPVTAETRIKDILPSRESLMTRDFFLRKFRITCTPKEIKEAADAAAKAATSQGLPPPPVVKADVPNLAAATGLLDCTPVAAKKGTTSSLTRLRRSNELDQVNWGQAIIERPNMTELTTEILPFNLGKAIAGEEADNLALKPGDTITIFSQQDIKIPADRQTHLVRLQGEVNAPGVYQIKPRETLPDLIERAGGYTPNAYVYGTILSRLSVRERQMENLQVVIRQLEAQLTARNSEMIASASQAELSQATALQAQNAQNLRSQIERMKGMVPNGRIALEIDPRDPSIPNFKLEDGDDITIPTAPDFISVVGAVHNENVLIYREGRRVSAYLDVAGVTERAETSEIFVVRADGSIKPPSARRARVYPGDTIVVPEKYYKESGYSIFMRGLKDWTQIFFQLGLGAAAIHTLNK